MVNISLYVTTVLVWGTTWLAVKYQLGVVPPEVSVAYRFILAAAIMVSISVITREKLRYSLRDHLWMAQQGFFLFSANYILFYLGTQYLTSGLVAVVFSTVVVMNIIGSAIAFKAPIEPRVALGAGFGMLGIATIFWPEISQFDLSRDGSLGLALCLGGTLAASIGMLTSGANQKRGLSVKATNTYGMIYGSIFTTLFAIGSGAEFTFEYSSRYIWSLAYLGVFASVIAFWCYLTLLGRIGADRASYATVLFPIVALALSTWFEGFIWTETAIIGIAFIIAGNIFVLTRGTKKIPMLAK